MKLDECVFPEPYDFQYPYEIVDESELTEDDIDHILSLRVEYNVRFLHDEILSSEDLSGLDIGERVCELFGVPGEEIVTLNEYEKMKRDFSENMRIELGHYLSNFYVNRFFKNFRKKEKETYSEMFGRFGSLGGEIAEPWIPLYISYVHYVIEMSEDHGIGEIVFLARDAIPFFLIAHQLKKRDVCPMRIHLVDLNRNMLRSAFGMKMMDISENCVNLNEIKDKPLYRYINSIFDRNSRITWVETGLYGTFLKILIKAEILVNPLVFFFSSRNPSILGYTNTIINGYNVKGGNIPPKFAVICADTTETSPKLYSPSKIVESDRSVEAVANISDPISIACSLGEYHQILKGILDIDLFTIDPEKEISNLYQKFIEVKTNKNLLPVVLPTPTKKWEYSKRWCEKWDLGPLPPIDEMIGPESG